MGSDTLAQAPSLTYVSTPDMSKTGAVAIQASGAAIPNGNYDPNITYLPGVLTIQEIPTYTVTVPTAENGTITADKAKEIALNHAGLTADQVTFVRSNLDQDDGRTCYDVEFYTADYTEYDYEIDANTGDVLSYDYDAEGYQGQSQSGSTTAITADRAKEIALAEVPGATASDICEFETDRDDGRLEYEGTIYYNGTEYDFTIDGYSGAIRGWDVERH